MAVNERLFREELDYLRRYGKLMARENPRLEKFLATQGADPGVERLLEGFSLLSARLREKIEDEYPELTVPLITRLWPGYLRPVPAITVIEYTPDRSRLTMPVMISRGEQVMNRVQDSQPENARPGEEGADGPPPCVFTLCRDIRLLPLHTEAIQNRSSLSTGIMDMTFSITGNARITANDLNGISFWLGSEDECSRHQLYLWQSRYRTAAELIVGEQHYPQPELALSPAGFSAQESPLPDTDRDGYRIVQDWLCFPDVQDFFILSGIAFPGDALTSSFTLRLHFNRPLPENLHLNREALRLHCAPAVNLFVRDAVPFTPDASRRDWPLLSAMTPNYLVLDDVEVLRDILRTFDRCGIHEPLMARLSPEKLAALERLETRPSDRLFKGIPRRGCMSTRRPSPARAKSTGWERCCRIFSPFMPVPVPGTG